MPRLPGKKAKARKDVTHALKDSATSDVSDGFTLCPKNVVTATTAKSWTFLASTPFVFLLQLVRIPVIQAGHFILFVFDVPVYPDIFIVVVSQWAFLWIIWEFSVTILQKAQPPHSAELDSSVRKGFQEWLLYFTEKRGFTIEHRAIERLGDLPLPEWATGLVPVMRSPPIFQAMMELRGDSAIRFMNLLHEVLDASNRCLIRHTMPSGSPVLIEFHATALQILVRLAQSFGDLPTRIIYTAALNINFMAPVGQGAFGNIYRATRRGQRFAVKEPRTFGDEDKKMAFMREVLLIEHIRHKHILPVHGVTYRASSASPCLVMPWMANGTVTSYLRRRREDAGRLFLQTCQAVAYIHAHGILHNDLRGANVLIDDGGNARLADFGLATFANAIVPRAAGWYVGNACWIAPELVFPQMFGRAAEDYHPSIATEAYSLACLCWEMYTLCRPFGLGRSGEVKLKVVWHERPERPTADRHGVDMPDALWDLLERSWYAVPEARPGIDEVIATLTLLLTATPLNTA